MKLALIGAILVLTAFLTSAQETIKPHALLASDSVVWCGLDYSMMRMIGRSNDFKVPDLLFQDMPRKWNDLFIDERLEGVANRLAKRVLIDPGGLTECNKAIKTNQLMLTNDINSLNDLTQIRPEEIAVEIQSYKLEHTNGLGLVFIVDKMGCQIIPAHRDAKDQPVPPLAKHFGAAYVVYFDIGTREVLSAKREVSNVETGGSFLTFWFGPIKTIDSGLEKYH
jgi:hypothetical protein